MIDGADLALSKLQKYFLRSRWLEQVLRIEVEANRASRRYHALRVVSTIGSILILMLVTLRLDTARWAIDPTVISGVTIGLSLLVTMSMALEYLFDYGERSRQFERTSDRLKREGWRFFELSGHYSHYESHSEAFPQFVSQVETISQKEVEAYSLQPLWEMRTGGDAESIDRPKKLEAPSREHGQSVAGRTSVHPVGTPHLKQQRSQ
jgi:hypothetical protein